MKRGGFFIWAFGIFVVCFFSASFYLASHRSLCETLEAESALVAKAFFTGKATLINQLNGKEDLDKPPGFYWLIAALYNVSPSWEVAARLPSILAIALFLFLFWKVAKISGFDKRLYILWAFSFLFCPKIFWMSQIARMDLFFSALCFLSIYFFIMAIGPGQAIEEAKTHPLKQQYLLYFYISTALAVMFKGPLGAVLIFGTVFFFLLFEKRPRLFKDIFFSPYLLVFLALSIPWYVYVTIKTDFRFFHRFILEENLSRFTNLLPGVSIKEFNHSPSTRYVVYLLTGFFPWSLLVPIWLYKVFKTWKLQDSTSKVFFIYFCFLFLFFSLAMSKRSDYILPLYPAAAFFSARLLFEDKKVKFLKNFWSGTSLFLCVIFFILFLSGAYFSLYGDNFIQASFIKQEQRELASFLIKIISNEYLLFFMPFLGFAAFLAKFRKREGEQSVSFFFICGAISILVVGIVTLPALYKGKDARPFCLQVKRIVGSSPLYYAGFWDEECTFYLDRIIEKLPLQKAAKLLQTSSRSDEKGLFFIIDKKRYSRLKKMGISFKVEYKDKKLVLRPLFLVK